MRTYGRLDRYLLLLTSALAGSLSAQPGVPGIGDDQYGEQLLFGEIPSVFSASKYEQKATEAPSRVSVVTADEIRRYGYRDLADILRSLPGFHTTWDRNYGYVGVRGFGIPGDYDTKLLLLVNGHRINDNIYDSLYSDYGFILDVDLIDRVEVVRGPGSSLYGSSAFFGVVNVITKRGRDLGGAEVSGAFGRHDSYQGRLSYGNRFDKGVEVLVSGTYHESDGTPRLYYPEFDDPATNNGFAEDADDETFKNFFGSLSYGDFTLEGAYVDREKGIPTASYETVFNDPRTRTWDGHAYANLRYRRLLDGGTDLSARLFYDRYWYDGDWAYDYSEEGDLSEIELFHDSADGEWWGTEVQLSRHLFERHRLIAGAEYRDSLKAEQNEYDAYEVYLDEAANGHTWGVYAQDEFRVRDELALNLGLRYDYYSSTGGDVNPRAALIWSVAEPTTLKFIYGTAFRAPNAYELYYNDGDFTQKQAGDLDAEEIETFELILDHQFTRRWRGIASLYRNNLENLITLTTDPKDGLLVFENLDDAKATGVDLELEGNWGSGWSGAISYSYQRAEDKETGERLVNSPRHLAKLKLLAPLGDDDFTAGLELLYENGRMTLAGDRTDSSLITNLTLFSQKWVKGLRLSGSLYNLFDQNYAHPASEEHEQDVIPQDGRTFRLKLDYSF